MEPGSLLRRARYEVFPAAGVEDAVLEHVPQDVTVTVTTSPRKGLEPTLVLVERLAGHGYDVVPHLAARHVRDRSHLADVVERLLTARASDVLVMAGDAPEPAGEFDGSLPLLRALAELGRPFPNVGITGYPESHAFLSDAAATRAQREKEQHATYVVSQVCFDARAIAAWVGTTTLAVRLGVPGPVERARLVRVSERIGVGESIRILRAQPGESFDPSSLVNALGESFGASVPSNVAGLHVFTFNELEATDRWRQKALERLSVST